MYAKILLVFFVALGALGLNGCGASGTKKVIVKESTLKHKKHKHHRH